MKISIQANNLKIAITTDCGGEIYTYAAAQTSTVVDVLAIISSSGELTTAFIDAIKAAETAVKSVKQQD